jgi:hypothetical protein
MVMLTNAQLARMLGPNFGQEMQQDKTVAPDSYLTKSNQETIGYGVRLEFPLSHSQDLRRMAEHLRGLAEHFDALSRRTDMTERAILLEAMFSVRDLQARLRQFKVRRRQHQTD